MTDKELNKMFFNTLKALYYDRMIGNSNKDFSDVVLVGEMIEAGVKQGKIENAEAKKLISKKKRRNPRDNIPRKGLQLFISATTKP